MLPAFSFARRLLPVAGSGEMQVTIV